MLNSPVDVSADFAELNNLYFCATRAASLDAASASGLLEWKRHQRAPRSAFSQVLLPLVPVEETDFPPDYVVHPALPFSLSFISPRTVRLRVATGPAVSGAEPSLMLTADPKAGPVWEADDDGARVVYRGPHGSVSLARDPWRIELRDAAGRLLTSTLTMADNRSLQNVTPMPFSFVRRATDWQQHMAATFALAPDEKLYGCGESFTRLNKRGQKVVLWTQDAEGAQSSGMYKPIPFFLSSRGYGMFVHTSTPVTLDMGCGYDGANTLYVGDNALDLFIFVGSPKEILAEYTALTGRSPTPPLWSFGLWMGRLTYSSEPEVRGVAADLRRHRVPCDVIHIDTGWFEKEWRCDYRFSPSRFPDPETMIADLRAQGFRISLWQLPYYTPHNTIYRQAVEAGFVVRSADGKLPTEDAVLDFSNPAAVAWYQGLLSNLLEMGVGAIKVDFGEAAPLIGAYASGRSGVHEHNLYPLRYNRAVAEVTQRVTGQTIIWARSAWAGSQRYPLHWGGDAENTDCAMAATLRAGLSFGLSGFSFWSHDMGGMVHQSPRELYRRWVPFGMLTSHSRCHGTPPREPWAYDEAFVDEFRRAVELKYRLMPYVYAQARLCSTQGLPMLRALFLEYPEDPTAWLIEDEYLFGQDLLVAPLFEATPERDLYLPPGVWIDYQTGRRYEGARWHKVAAGEIPILMFVRDGAVVPHIGLAQSTATMDWKHVDLVVFAERAVRAEGLVALPDDGVLHKIVVDVGADQRALLSELPQGVTWNVRRFACTMASQPSAQA